MSRLGCEWLSILPAALEGSYPLQPTNPAKLYSATAVFRCRHIYRRAPPVVNVERGQHTRLRHAASLVLLSVGERLERFLTALERNDERVQPFD